MGLHGTGAIAFVAVVVATVVCTCATIAGVLIVRRHRLARHLPRLPALRLPWRAVEDADVEAFEAEKVDVWPEEKVALPELARTPLWKTHPLPDRADRTVLLSPALFASNDVGVLEDGGAEGDAGELPPPYTPPTSAAHAPKKGVLRVV
ncbi:hypothetical protein PsYK624_051010 [Phanerochaete sordida]|uniref:Uncharacterized protein n=1 Tax=Phanerochaete sordida TaxID=48140 RepID=A0A9P3G6L0_9APHY|nr:hypothetical protein PsYK624_051010 [Phanerochaete sordida]